MGGEILLRVATSVRRLGRGLLVALVALSMQLTIAGCATPGRLPAAPRASEATPEIKAAGHIRFLAARDTADFIDEARQSIRKERAWREAHGETGPLPELDLLAISGGGDSGAFAAGVLNGWTAAGTRPEFKAVTGVSTGALIAPFAFLGPRYDYVLTAVYTQSTSSDIFRRRNLLSAFFGDALSDTTPLYKLLSKYVNQSLLDQIAAEYAKGRVLLVGTTLLDTPEPVIWNMTAIAASHDPRAVDLFRKIMLASASIPGAFPPQMIDVELDGTHYQEMHVDGGAMAQVFAYPPSLNLRELSESKEVADRQRNLYIIRNARLDPEWANVQRRTLSIAGRAISSLMMTQGIGDLYRIYTVTQRDGVNYNLAFVPSTFNVPHTKQFDTTYMRALYKVGYDMAVAGYPWQKTPPGYAAPAIGSPPPEGQNGLPINK